MPTRQIIPCLAVSHVDLVAAKRWLKWASFLCTHKGGGNSKNTLVILVTKRVGVEGIKQLEDSVIESNQWFKTVYDVCDDENEVGYPMSANHLFLSALKYCRNEFPDNATLFIEPDCVPINTTWFKDIQSEYSSHDKEFSGDRVVGPIPHMTGNAVYGVNWPKLAPSILGVTDRQSSGGMFADGKGYPFDLHIGPEVLSNFHKSDAIFQLWQPGAWTRDNVNRIPANAKLVHQDKDGTLILTIARVFFPQFFEHLPKPSKYFLLQNPNSDVDVSGRRFSFTPCARTPDGAWWSVYRPEGIEDEIILGSVAGRMGISVIDENDYNCFLRQKRK